MPSSRIRYIGLIPMIVVAFIFAASCSKGPNAPPPPPHLDPQTELTFAPIEFDTTAFRVHFFWNAYDDDGEVMRFHIAVDADTLLPINEWRTTTAKDTILLFLVDPVKELKVHVFRVSAEDNEGRWDKTPASRAFSAKTAPPTSKIERGPEAFNPLVGPNFTFEWSGIDPDGGETGGKAAVDSFQYLLLRIGGIADTDVPPTHDPLPPQWCLEDYTAMIRAAVGDALPALWISSAPPCGDGRTRRIDDWRWQGIRGTKKRFRNVTPGEYVFAERAVDIAGATEKDLEFRQNIRHFSVTNQNFGPTLTVCSSILNNCLGGAKGPDDFARKQLQVFEGETVSFSWSATAETYGGEIVGYTYALDDTSTFPGLDPRQLGVTFRPSDLFPGNHFLYVRCVDDGGLVTNFVLPLLIVHPNFKDPTHPRAILFVDDSSMLFGGGNSVSDQTETDWWNLGTGGVGPLFSTHTPYLEWDTIERAQGSIEGRKQPDPSDLAEFTTVVWTTDNNNGSAQNGALFKTIAGGDYSELQGYLRAGGTMILTGWNLAASTTGGPSALMYTTTGGICGTFLPNSTGYNRTLFPRMYMGLNRAEQNTAGLRTQGLADFVRGVPTPRAAALGFDTARVDTGNGSMPRSSYKWNTQTVPPPGNLESQLFPGLPVVEGWYLAPEFGCQPIQNFGYEDHSQPIVQVLYTYHGVREGPLQDQGPSPREGLPCASFVQSHDFGTSGGHYDPSAAIGRIAFFTFPLYFLKDADAVNIMVNAFNYVNHSPTLPPIP
ncbi:MAG TPA: hypothetical protein VGK76_02150 [Candidatus Eisenbacteria bacterium]